MEDEGDGVWCSGKPSCDRDLIEPLVREYGCFPYASMGGQLVRVGRPNDPFEEGASVIFKALVGGRPGLDNQLDSYRAVSIIDLGGGVYCVQRSRKKGANETVEECVMAGLEEVVFIADGWLADSLTRRVINGYRYPMGSAITGGPVPSPRYPARPAAASP